MTLSVPVLSLKAIDDPAGKAALAQQFGAAARNSGFMQIVDHGISADLLQKTFDISKKIFKLSLAEKALLKRNVQTNRGYDDLGGQSLDGAILVGHESQNKTTGGDTIDLKEGYMIGKEIDKTDEYWGRFGHGPNVLPSEEQVPGVRAITTEYYDTVLALSRKLMEVAALSLDLPIDAFAPLCREPACAIRLLHYPPELEGMGAGAHTDFGLITLLATSGAPGLELFTGSTWVPVEPAPGAYIVNVGDILSLYTGGEYKSSLHRVLNKSGVERYSIPFFLDGNSDILVKPIKGDTSLTPVTVEEHLRNRFDNTYSSKSAEASMKAVVAGVTA